MATLSILQINGKHHSEDLLEYMNRILSDCNAEDYGFILFCTTEDIMMQTVDSIGLLQQLEQFDKWSVPTQNGANNIHLFIKRSLFTDGNLQLKLKFSDRLILALKCQYKSFKFMLGIFLWPQAPLMHQQDDEIEKCIKQFNVLKFKATKPVILLGEIQGVSIAAKDTPIATPNTEKVIRARHVFDYFTKEKQLIFYNQYEVSSSPLITLVNKPFETKCFVTSNSLEPVAYRVLTNPTQNTVFYLHRQIIKIEPVGV